ncbi:hypothetical protein Nm8I071_64100 [Nonomuraea sp. TT08I-71]|nr:hypothetical protein Nm8I071_64100 [Nonomuraea sp. TT08I-71]
MTVRLFRPTTTRLLLVGGVRAAQLLALRALALGARVAVQTTRPRVWEPFVRGVGAPGGAVPLVPRGGRSAARPGRRCARCCWWSTPARCRRRSVRRRPGSPCWWSATS